MENLEIIDVKQFNDQQESARMKKASICMTVQKLFFPLDCPGQVDLPAGQETFHSHLPDG